MRPRICICCGEPMAEKGDAFCGNPNVCGACSSLLDGASEFSPSSLPDFSDRTGGDKDFSKIKAEQVSASVSG